MNIHSLLGISEDAERRKRKSLFATYILWAFAGGLGLHHLYLGRDIQAFVWCSTFGGFFGVGWLRDCWRIPSYVKQANLHLKQKSGSSTTERNFLSSNVSRFCGEVMVGFFYGLLFHCGIISKSQQTNLIAVMEALGVSLGVYLVGNIGNETGKWKTMSACSIIFSLSTFHHSSAFARVFMLSLFAASIFQKHRTMLPKSSKTKLSRRLAIYALCVILIHLFWGCSLDLNPLLKFNTLRNNGRSVFQHFTTMPINGHFSGTMVPAIVFRGNDNTPPH